jgi:hypothetical protein
MSATGKITCSSGEAKMTWAAGQSVTNYEIRGHTFIIQAGMQDSR